MAQIKELLVEELQDLLRIRGTPSLRFRARLPAALAWEPCDQNRRDPALDRAPPTHGHGRRR